MASGKLRLIPWVLVTVAFLFTFAYSARADEFVYGNNASSPTTADIVSKIDITTGTVVANYDVGTGNGRGVVVVGNTMYTTTAGSNNVYSFDLSTDTSNGVAFSVSGATALSTMAYDGTNFWIGDYSGTNNVYEYSPTGTLLSTISLSLCSSYCDGLEYLAANGGELISNEFDGAIGNSPYDIYKLDGTLVTAGFIDTSTACNSNPGTTGIAFDGTNYFVSCFYNSSLAEYDSSGQFVQSIPFTGTVSYYVEDLSANYAEVLPPVSTPEPSTISELLAGLLVLGLGEAWRRKHKTPGLEAAA